MTDQAPTPVFDPRRYPSRVWQAVWQAWPLWLAAFGGALVGGLGGVDSGLSPMNLVMAELTPGLGEQPDPERLLALFALFNQPGPLLYGLAAMMVLGLVLLFAGAWVEGALVAGVAARLRDDTVTVPMLVRAGRQHVWPVFVLKLLIGVSLAVPVAVTAVSLFGGMFAAMSSYVGVQQMVQVFGVFVLALCPVLLLFVVVSVVFSWLEVLAVRAAVLEASGLLGAIRHGWRLLRAQWRRFVPVWAVVSVVAWLANAVLDAPLQAIGAAVSAQTDVFAVLVGQQPADAGLLLVAFAAVALGLVAAALGGAVHLLAGAVLTTAYVELNTLYRDNA